MIFNNKKEYIPLKNALVQLHNLIIKRNYKYLIKILKETILFCYNSKPKTNLYFPFFKMKNYFFTNNEPLEQSYVKINNSLNSENMPNVPFIKSPMKKKFCLVLDIDETISHTLKLSCGFYFLLRPGTIEFLKQVSKYYEIIIFTAERNEIPSASHSSSSVSLEPGIRSKAARSVTDPSSRSSNLI